MYSSVPFQLCKRNDHFMGVLQKRSRLSFKEDISAIQFDYISEESMSDSKANHFNEYLKV